MNSHFRCGPDLCKQFFDSSQGVSLHHLSCPHYEAYASHPQGKQPFPQPSILPPKRLHIKSINPGIRSHLDSHPDSSPPHLVALGASSTTAPSTRLDQMMVPALDNQQQPTSNESPQMAGSWPVHTQQLPACFRDILPEPALPVPMEPAPLSCIPHVILHVFNSFCTTFNPFGIAWEYHHWPSQDPDSFLILKDLSNQHSAANEPETLLAFSMPPVPSWLWKSMLIWRLMSWMLSGSNQKSVGEVTCLADTVITTDDFCPADLMAFNASTKLKYFDNSENEMDPENPFCKDGWLESSVTISMSTYNKNPAGNGQDFAIPGFFHYNLTAVVHVAFTHLSSKLFHFTPFKWIWRCPSCGIKQQIYNKLYTSDTWIQAHDDIQKQCHSNGCKLEWVVAAMMFSSDSTHLAQFGHASAWPVYLSFGNLSKYICAWPITSGAFHLMAFIPKVFHISRLVHHTSLMLTTQ